MPKMVRFLAKRWIPCWGDVIDLVLQDILEQTRDLSQDMIAPRRRLEESPDRVAPTERSSDTEREFNQ
jgi:hypothetical protein